MLHCGTSNYQRLFCSKERIKCQPLQETNWNKWHLIQARCEMGLKFYLGCERDLVSENQYVVGIF